MTLLNQSVQGNTYSYTYSLAFPTKSTGTIVVTVDLNQTYVPNTQDLKSSAAGPTIYGLAFSSSSSPAKNSASLKFFLPYSSLPANVVKQKQALTTSPAPSGGYPYFVAARYVTGGEQLQEGSEPSGAEGAWISFEETIAETMGEDLEDAFNELFGAGGGGTGGALSRNRIFRH